ncbi:hypothetical protein CO101_02480 [Candidatus Berkelbacteria bacterium CG_4_9_14_3_um_filter_39_23]|uniref:Uncharacterized protein n=2 Tax=Candidatus Berkelbacteria TaxID=1618330 RepID=A0A2M7CHX6_9BACT|nr:hypothetical protein [Candidatus Berkelbacteria bacterium]OIP05908.1 MAG: hypothetical protein AUK14_00735 [Candidatus Berkelbacteria bacterium CG2_30_39_44]PIR27682.1 MAG: hypothetical protein COV39_03185 [Candidatus Berkelbacteria bacterium CG11_big_fil_rev_8_21_14_0_20_40_23]PIV25235.1 MAG: hypothetical protein COS38_02700 [Candidatus Berkelbacteria bacterium CG03_land_8_20_14_0_80_40_36]PIX30780.1 MAG: hypothetical protein COZ62_00820 [Candidatus Berkelbacteria bacterium CG_4_8_14_3_um_f
MIESKLHQQLIQSNEKLAHRKSCWYGLFYGMAMGLGVTIGSTVVVWAMIYALQKLQIIPVFNSGQFEGIINLLQSNNETLQNLQK